MIYTLIAYTPSGEDYCRGCLMESWGSSHEICSYERLDLLADRIAEIQFNDQNKQDRSPDTELTILIYEANEDDYEKHDQIRQTISELVSDFKKGLQQELDKQKANAEQLEQARKQKALLAAEVARRKQYEELKKVYES